MKLFVAVLTLLLFAIPSPAQRAKAPAYVGHDQALYPPPKPEHTVAEMIAVREKLIKRWVLDQHVAWGVSVSGTDSEDVFGNDDSASWLTVYVYRDSLKAFADDLNNYATRNNNGIVQVDGVTIMVEVIERPKKGEAKSDEPAKIERNDRQPDHQNSRGSAAVSGRPSRA